MNPPVLEQTTVTPRVNRNCLSTGGPFKLNLGGAGEGFLDGKIEGFLTVDLRDAPDTDIVSDISLLPMFKDESVDEIYCSNALEHFPIHETQKVLKEWFRVLKPKGKLYISVPDFDIAVKLYLKFGLTQWLQYHLWGDQKHPLNYHYITFTMATLSKALIDVGFNDVRKVSKWPFKVHDGSQNVDTLTKQPISLNVEAVK